EIVARCASVGLAHRDAPREIDVEQVQLAIASEETAGRVEHAACVVRAWLAGDGFQERTCTKMDASLAGDRRHGLRGRPGHGLRVRHLVAPWAAPGEDLGKHDELRAA